MSNPEDSIVYTYLYRLLNRGPPSANDGGIGLGIKNVPTASSNGSELQASQTSQEEYEVNERLRRIFDKISESTTNKEGIADLYTFQKEHPEKQPRIEKQLSDLGEVFNSYIKRVLQRLAGEDAERASITSPALTQSGEYFISHDDKSDHLSIAQLDSAPVPQSPGVAVPRSRSSLSSQHEHRTSLDEKNLNRISTLFGSKPQSLYTPETEAPTVFSQTENYRPTINENEDVF